MMGVRSRGASVRVVRARGAALVAETALAGDDGHGGTLASLLISDVIGSRATGAYGHSPYGSQVRPLWTAPGEITAPDEKFQ
jgi:hypothetical protein